MRRLTKPVVAFVASITVLSAILLPGRPAPAAAPAAPLDPAPAVAPALHGTLADSASAPGGVPSPDLGSTPVSASFVVHYGASFSPEARAAFQSAVDIWSHLIASPVPIVIDAGWAATDDPRVLGSANPVALWSNFTGAPKADTWYPSALASALHGSDIDPQEADIAATFNSSYPWYLGTDGLTTAGLTDFETVVLHEIGHGLGFDTQFSYTGNGPDAVASWDVHAGFPYAFARGVVSSSVGTSPNLVGSFVSESVALGGQLTEQPAFFAGTHTTAANGGMNARLYVPAIWQPGSSLSHLDEASYPAGDPNSLMTPFLGPGESIHDPGPIALGILADIGWPLPLPMP